MPVNISLSTLHTPESAGALPRPALGDAGSAEFSQNLARAEAEGSVRAERTELSGDQAASALRNAWHDKFGQDPSPRTLAILVGHWAHETGRGEAMLNYNFGGIKGTGPSGLSAVYKTHEGSGENERKISDRFRAYASADEGARDYMGLLARRYGNAVESAGREDAVGFVQALKAKGYFTGDEQAYIKSVSGLARQALTQGFNAIGASEGNSAVTAGAVTASPVAASPVTASGLQARAPEAAPPIVPLGSGSDWLTHEPLLAATEPTVATSVHALMFADECTRAALLIAARQGVRNPKNEDSAI